MSEKRVGHRVEQPVPQCKKLGGQLIPLGAAASRRKEQFDAVVSHIRNLKAVVMTDFVLEAQGPLLHIRRRPEVLDGIGRLTDVGQGAVGLPRRQQQSVGERIVQQVDWCDAINRSHIGGELRKPVQG